MVVNLKQHVPAEALKKLNQKLDLFARNSSTQRDSLTAQKQADALAMYLSEYDDFISSDQQDYDRQHEVSGQELSEFKENSIAEVVHFLIAEIMPAFYQGVPAVFKPPFPEADDIARKSSFFVSNTMFGEGSRRWLTNYILEGFIQKLGLIRVDMMAERWESVIYEHQTKEQIALIRNQPDIRPPQGAQDMPFTQNLDGTFSILVEKRRPRRIVISSVPVERRLIPHRTSQIDQSTPEGADYIGEMHFLTFGQLIKKFPDEADFIRYLKEDKRLKNFSVNSETEYDYDERTQQRFADEDYYADWDEGGTQSLDGFAGETTSEERYETFEEYVRCDIANNGQEGLYRVQRVGTEIISLSKVPDNPYSSWTPFPTPHKLTGMSIIDKLGRWQTLAEVSKRAEVNSVAYSAMPRFMIPEDSLGTGLQSPEKTLSDFQNPRPNQALIISGEANRIMPFPIDPRNAQEARNLHMTARERLEKSSGMTGIMQGSETTNIGRAATTMQLAQQRGQTPLKWFADEIGTSLERAAKRCLHLFATQGDPQRMRDEKGNWLYIAPQELDVAMECRVDVSGAIISRDQKINWLSIIFEAQKSALEMSNLAGSNPFTKPEHIAAVIREMVRTMNISATDRFIAEPSPEEIQAWLEEMQNQKDPEIEKAQMQADTKMFEVKTKQQTDLHIAALNAKLKQFQILFEGGLEDKRIEVEKDLEEEHMRVDEKIKEKEMKNQDRQIAQKIRMGGEKTA